MAWREILRVCLRWSYAAERERASRRTRVGRATIVQNR
jgi:hypothetical protein